MKKKMYEKSEMTLEDFKKYIEKTYRGKYAGKYTLDESTWVDKDAPMMIHCREHGWFERIPMEFGQGFVCPYESNAMRNNLDWQKRAFEEKGKIQFGDRFEYHIAEYVNAKTPIKITCKEHGDFYTTPDNHLNATLDGGCQGCFGDKMRNQFLKSSDVFIAQSERIWGQGVFDYSNLNYQGRSDYVTLRCLKHNISFNQLAYKHLLHHYQCPKCYGEQITERQLMETPEFIERATMIHDGKYTYEKTDTKNRNEDGKVCITCPNHGDFWQKPVTHLAGCGCPKCGHTVSRAEQEIFDFIKTNLPNEEIIQGSFKVLGRKQLDMYLPNKKVAIEYNGLHWHSEEFGRGETYHLEKLEACNALDIELIQIFEDEWVEHKDIVLSKIAHSLKFETTIKKVRGHKCYIKEISKLIAEPFFDKNHIQGFTSGSVILGAFYENEMVGGCVFKREKNENHWELTRMATKNGYLCYGVCGKMFKIFIDAYNPIEIKSFADRRWTLNKNNNLYTKLGFILDKTLKPDYRYVIGNKRIHKFNCRKQTLSKKFGFPLSMTESEMTRQLGYDKIWDCGLFKYVWRA